MSQSAPAPTWAPAPTVPRPRLKKPLYKRWWFTAIISIAVVAAIGWALEEGKILSSKSMPQSQSASQSQNVPEAKAAPQAQSASEAAASAVTPTPEAESKVSREYENALESAKSYSSVMHISKKDIYNQLISPYADKFSAEAAQYAVDNLQADYNANALAKTKEYQETMYMSSQVIRDQLTSEHDEKFIVSEVDYAITHLND